MLPSNHLSDRQESKNITIQEKKDAHHQNFVDCLFFDRRDSSRRLRTRQSSRFQTLQAKQNSLESKNNHQTRLGLSGDAKIVSESRITDKSVKISSFDKRTKAVKQTTCLRKSIS